LKVAPPIDYEVLQLKESFTKFDSLLKEGFDNVEIPADEEFDEFIAALNKYPHANSSMDTLANVFNRVSNNSALVMVDRTLPTMNIAAGNVNIYSPLVPSDIMLSDSTMTAADRKEFLEPLLDRQGMCNSIEYINRILGFEPQVAMDKAVELLIDFQRSTTYPPKVKALPEPSKVALDIENLISAILVNRNKVEEDTE
jgi:hypothetical protein